MSGQSINVFDRNEDSVSVGVVELNVLCLRSVARLQPPGPGISADAMRGMHHQLAWLKG
jgi:hypothetical protein